jgi:hypothetical protein
MTSQQPRTVSLDLQSHLADLKKRGLLVRVDELRKDGMKCEFTR